MVSIHPIPEKLIQKNRQAQLHIRAPEDQLEDEARIERCRAIAKEIQNYERELSNIENRIRGAQSQAESAQARLEISLGELRNTNNPENQRALEREANSLRQARDDFLFRLSEHETEKNKIEEDIESLKEAAEENRCNFV